MQYQLAEINIGRILAPLNSPLMHDFVANLDDINALADNSPGFVWRLKSDSNNATSIRIFDDEYLIVNLSVWNNMQSLHDYVYKSLHVEFFKRKKEWFQKMDTLHMALWYIPAGKMPTVDEALERLVFIREHKETPYAFTFKKSFPLDACIDFVP